MYTEERKENMTSQVSQLHHHEMREEHVSQETQEWQEMARREKHYVEYAESSHFSMVRQILNSTVISVNFKQHSYSRKF